MRQVNKTTQVILLALLLALTGCGANPTIESTSAPNDLLSKVLARGTILIATDAEYPPQSKLIEGAKRKANTLCASNEYTDSELTGFDVSTGIEIAKRLGVEACFVTPQWSQIIAGNWDDRWDISVGSMTITNERLNALYFTQPYYSTPAAIFIHKDNTTFKSISDLDGKRIGACTGCGYEDYLREKLDMPNNPVEYIIKNPQIIGYQVDIPALEDLALGDGVNIDAVVTAQPTGLQAIKDGMPIKQLGDPVFFEYLSITLDKKSKYNSFSLTSRIDEIIQSMHQDGTLKQLSLEHYGMDYTSVAATFDIKGIKQQP